MITVAEEERARPAPLAPYDEHNRALEANVRPPEWNDPEPAPRYDMVVVGGGTAGLVTAAGAAGLGARVALVERGLLGGDCLNVGCVPSKALIRAARAAAEVRRAAELGVRTGAEAEVDFAAVMERMRRLRAGIAPHDSAARFRELGVDVFLGGGRFSGPDAVEVGGATLRFGRACIATGGRPAAPPVPGLAEAGYLTNESLFSLTELPARLAVVGGGPIGCEMAQAFARFGARVTLVEVGDQIMGREDPDAAEVVRRALEADGVDVRTGRRLVSVAASDGGGGKRLRLEGGSEPEEIEADAILVAVGRAPNVDGLGLESAGVESDPRAGVRVDERLRTANRRIFAAGDVCSVYKFTHAADAMARIVIRNALFFGRAKASDLVVPWCTYTEPEVAHTGLYERDAREKGLDVESHRVELASVDRAVLDGETEGFLKVLAERRSGRILGATLVSAHAGESISEATLAIRKRARLGDLSDTIHPYPTQAEVFRRAGDAFRRSKLTARAKRWLARALALQRLLG